jgi:hypothetical protein
LRNSYKISVGNPESRRPLARPRRGWKDDIKVVLPVLIKHHATKTYGGAEVQLHAFLT